MRKLCQSLFLVALATCGGAPAARPSVQHIVCPAELPESALRAGIAFDGWIPHVNGPFRLSFAAPTGGPPEQDAELAFYTTTRSNTARTNTYDLRPPNPGGIWIKCAYGELGDLSLHRRLDDRIEQCSVTVSNALPRKIDIECQ
ncbi:STY0301 family protein [Massilia sp. DWR3-1-1]|uniref:STY0301 family protein n=1 Tax=Massilia sp. DWR3-1-1 TaxID=2804559 RepID=UPI003CEF16DA